MKRLVKRFEDGLMLMFVLSPFWVIALLLLISTTIPVKVSEKVLQKNSKLVSYNKAVRQVADAKNQLEKELKALNEAMRKQYGWK